jgi:hypothetical protein
MAQALADRAAVQWGHLPAFEYSTLKTSLHLAPNSAVEPPPQTSAFYFSKYLS